MAHAELNTNSMGVETCAVCHQSGRIADIDKAHELKTFLNVIENFGPAPTSVDIWRLLNQ